MWGLMGDRQSYQSGLLCVLLATVGWSLSGLFARLMPELQGWQMNCWRGYWMSVSLLVWLVWLYGRDTWQRFRDVPMPAMLATVIFFSAGSTFYLTSLTLTSIAVVAVIGATSPIFTGLLSPWITGEKPGLSNWVAAGLALAGVLVIGWNGLAAGTLIGVLVSIMVPICFAAQTMTLRRYRGVDMVPAVCVSGFAIFLVAGLLGNGFAVAPKNILLLALMGPLQLGIPLILYAKGARSIPAMALAVLAMTDVVLNPLWAWIGVGEVPAKAEFIGGFIVVGAVMLCALGDRIMTMRQPALTSA
jgi:drug/metabolite transporter (DMT)-like permease